MNYLIPGIGYCLSDEFLRRLLKDKYRDILDSMVLIHERKIGMPLRIKQYEYVRFNGANYVVMPRTFMARFPLPLKNLLTPHPISVELCGELYENQAILIDYLMANKFTPDNIANGTACSIINVKAGNGKSFIGAGVIARLKMRTLWVTITKSLAQQACDDLRILQSGVDARKLYIRNFSKKLTKKEIALGNKADVCVILINSALKQKADFFAEYELVIFDEVHVMCTDLRRKIFRLANARVMLGMSATTANRKDEFDKVAWDEIAFGGVLHAQDIPGFKYDDSNFKCIVHAIRYNGPNEFTKALTHESTDKLFVPYMYEQFLSDPWRISLIAHEIQKLYTWKDDNSVSSDLSEGTHHNIFVFCEMRNPLYLLRTALLSLGIADIGIFMGGTTEEEFTTIKQNARIILTTYGYSSTGLSISRFTALVFLTPRRSGMQQILGRILRRGSDERITRVVVDVIDNRTPLRGQFNERLIGYQHYNMQMTYSKVNYSDVRLLPTEYIEDIYNHYKCIIQTNDVMITHIAKDIHPLFMQIFHELYHQEIKEKIFLFKHWDALQ